jgi:outer membrane protein OmpA-like peptidoglycan-associated protein
VTQSGKWVLTVSRVRLTFAAKAFLSTIILGATGLSLHLNPGLLGRVAPGAARPSANVPPAVALPDGPGAGGDAAAGRAPAAGAALRPAVDAPAGCADRPEVRFYHWAWNAQMGLMAATGGKQATAGSRMCRRGVNLKLVREDNVDAMQAQLLTFGEGLKAGRPNPEKGAHFVAIMGDGSATFLKGVNDKLARLGPDYVAQVVGSAGYSRGEDKFMGPPAWKQNPQAARGGLVAGVLRDGDWNVALKWLGDNKIANNPDETTYDPDALNWVAAADYVDAAQKYVSGFCADLKNVKSGKRERHCVDGVVTWTPGDVTVAEQRGGLVSIVSTREYRSQMPNVIIGHKKWMARNRELVTGMLGAVFEAGDAIKASDDELRSAAAVSALVYGEQDAAYWYRYFHVQTQTDKQGLAVELGGSAVSNLADNLQLFGLAPGSANLFAATYTVFGDLVKSQYPALLPAFDPVDRVLDDSFVRELAAAAKPATPADLAAFEPGAKVERVVSRRAWNVEFVSGRAAFTPAALAELERLFSELVVAGGTLVEVHGHTDDSGAPDANQRLSEARAFAVKDWLERRSPANFPEGRVRVFAHGQTQPVAPNATPAGKAKNRRVEIVLGTAAS